MLQVTLRPKLNLIWVSMSLVNLLISIRCSRVLCFLFRRPRHRVPAMRLSTLKLVYSSGILILIISVM